MLCVIGCSLTRAAEAPTTPFLVHASELHAQRERAPWDAMWSKNPGHILVQVPEVRHVYIAPINMKYLNMRPDAQGRWALKHEVDEEDAEAIGKLLRKSFIEELQKHPDAKIVLEEVPGPHTLQIEIALTELIPTSVGVNAVADVGGLLVPGAKLAENAAVAGEQAIGGAISAGSVAYELKISDGKTGEVIAEIKDRESDAMSVIPNYRDFEKYGWTRKAIAEWAEEFVEQLSTPASEQVAAPSAISIVPW